MENILGSRHLPIHHSLCPIQIGGHLLCLTSSTRTRSDNNDMLKVLSMRQKTSLHFYLSYKRFQEHEYIFASVYLCVSISLRQYIFASVYLCVSISMRQYIFASVYLCVSISMRQYIFASVYICVSISMHLITFS